MMFVLPDDMDTMFSLLMMKKTIDPIFLNSWKPLLLYKPYTLYPLPYLDPFLAWKLELKLQTWDIINIHYKNFLELGILPLISSSEHAYSLLLSAPPTELISPSVYHHFINYSYHLSTFHHTLYSQLDSIPYYSLEALKLYTFDLNSWLNLIIHHIHPSAPHITPNLSPEEMVNTKLLLKAADFLHNYVQNTETIESAALALYSSKA